MLLLNIVTHLALNKYSTQLQLLLDALAWVGITYMFSNITLLFIANLTSGYVYKQYFLSVFAF